MNILITNDDGINAPGIIELAKAMSKIANVYVVAPESQRSATGHSITIHSPIMVHESKIEGSKKAYSISGTPADCVKLGIEGLFKDIEIIDHVSINSSDKTYIETMIMDNPHPTNLHGMDRL